MVVVVLLILTNKIRWPTKEASFTTLFKTRDCVEVHTLFLRMSKLTNMFAARVNAKARLRIVNTLALRYLGKLLFYPLFALLCIFLPTSRSLPPFFSR